MRETIDTYQKNGATVRIEFDTGGAVGSTYLVAIAHGDPRAAIHGEGGPDDWVVNRWFYFGEFNEHYARNFAEKIITDDEYRTASLEGTADWKRVSSIYEEASRRIFDTFHEAGVLGHTAGDREGKHRHREASDVMGDLCEGVYDEVRDRVRNDRALDGLDAFIQQRVDEAEREAERLAEGIP